MIIGGLRSGILIAGTRNFFVVQNYFFRIIH